MKRVLLVLRLLRVGMHLLRGVLECALLFPLLGQARRMQRIGRWSGTLTRIFGITVHATGAVPSGGLLVANHVSWMDVFVLNAVSPCTFIAKSEVRAWPVIGLLSARAGTWFIARDRLSSLRATNARMARGLADGMQLAFFPEGTSAAQGAMQPFHANLFQGAVTANVAVHPVALIYLDWHGQPAASAEYIGDMSLGQSIVCVLAGGGCHAHVHFLPPIFPQGRDRRVLAGMAHAAIHAWLAGRVLAPSLRPNLNTAAEID